METFKRLLLMAKQYYLRFIFAAICMIIAGGLQSALPLIAKPAIDEIFVSKNIAASEMDSVCGHGHFPVQRIVANYGQNRLQ